jgi:hypothetical protein
MGRRQVRNWKKIKRRHKQWNGATETATPPKRGRRVTARLPRNGEVNLDEVLERVGLVRLIGVKVVPTAIVAAPNVMVPISNWVTAGRGREKRK